MFEKGDLVTYGCKGVCEVKNITTLNLEGIPKDRLYYEMQSMVNAGSRIFSPVGQEEKNAMRAVLTKEEAEAEEAKGNYVVEEEKGYRRIIAAPKPMDIYEIDAVRALLDAGQVVIAAGGGGIPVLEQRTGS